MQINEYQKLAARFMPPNLLTEEKMLLAALGIAGESGEAVDLIKKVHFHNKELDIEHFKRELGDICWYIACAASALEIPLEDVFQTNIEKLSARYPNGFNAYDANHRKEGDVQ